MSFYLSSHPTMVYAPMHDAKDNYEQDPPPYYCSSSLSSSFVELNTTFVKHAQRSGKRVSFASSVDWTPSTPPPPAPQLPISELAQSCWEMPTVEYCRQQRHRKLSRKSKPLEHAQMSTCLDVLLKSLEVCRENLKAYPQLLSTIMSTIQAVHDLQTCLNDLSCATSRAIIDPKRLAKLTQTLMCFNSSVANIPSVPVSKSLTRGTIFQSFAEILKEQIEYLNNDRLHSPDGHFLPKYD